MTTPYGAHVQLGSDRENMPLLHGRFEALGIYAVCFPNSAWRNRRRHAHQHRHGHPGRGRPLDGEAGPPSGSPPAPWTEGCRRVPAEARPSSGASPPPADLNSRLYNTRPAGRRVLLAAADARATCAPPLWRHRALDRPRLLRHQRRHDTRQCRPLRYEAAMPVSLRVPGRPRDRRRAVGLYRRCRPPSNPQVPR